MRYFEPCIKVKFQELLFRTYNLITILEKVVTEVKGMNSKILDWEWLEYKEEDRIEVNSLMLHDVVHITI